MNAQKPREIAVRILQQRRQRRGYLETLLDRALEQTRLRPADRRLCQELVCGVVRWEATLDWLIASRTAGRKQKPLVQDLLRLGLYQLFWLDRIPPHAVLHETVETAKTFGLGNHAGFINAILRTALHHEQLIRAQLDELKKKRPALGWSHPEWLYLRWKSRWGEARARQLLEWNNTPPATFARVNTLRTEPGPLLERWRLKENVEYDFVRRPWLEENLVFELKAHPPLSSLASFQKGWFYVQDPSTLLAPRELDPRPGESVLDFCAAPGGKTTYLAQLMRNQGRIVAQDTSNARLKLLAENCARLGVTCVEIRPVRSSLSAARADGDAAHPTADDSPETSDAPSLGGATGSGEPDVASRACPATATLDAPVAVAEAAPQPATETRPDSGIVDSAGAPAEPPEVFDRVLLDARGGGGAAPPRPPPPHPPAPPPRPGVSRGPPRTTAGVV
ncbi:MAG: transcription antitermination factor NusB [Verrucomicrobiales bacterium]|nr:transcription antitermination factor NusB [Verrucomicrobiales bacterium]